MALSGFAGGSVLWPAITEAVQTHSLKTYLPAGAAGALLYLSVWLIVSLILASLINAKPAEVRSRTGLVFAVSLAPLISYFPYLWYRLNLQGDSVEVPPLGARWSAIMLAVWSLLLLASLLRMVIGGNRSRLLDRLTRRPAVTLVVMMSFWLFLSLIIDVTKLKYMHVTSLNSAIFREAMLDVFDSRGFMWSNVLYGNGASIFAVHINAIFLFILPIFRLWPDYRLLLVLSDVSLALAAWPAYLIARRYLSTAMSLLIAAMLLINPIMTAQPGRSDFSELRFLPLFFLAACYFFERKRPWGFAIAAFLMLTIREDFGLLLAFFGIYALVRRYPLKWILLPIVSGLGWFVIMGAVLLPKLAPSGKAMRAAVRYSNLGSSGSEIAKTLIFRPWKAVQAAVSTPSHVGVIYGLFISFGTVLPFISGAIVLAVPGVSELLFQNETTLVNFMALTILPAMIFAFIHGLSKMDRLWRERWHTDAGKAAAIAGVFFFFLSASAFHTWFNPDLLRPRYNYEAAVEAFNKIPKDASIMIPEFMLAYSDMGQQRRGFHQIAYEMDLTGGFHISEDYIILDRRTPERAVGNRYYQGLKQATAFLEGSPDYLRIYQRDDIELYIRKDRLPGS